MRKFYQLSTLVLTLLLIVSTSSAQDFSNKGKDFWIPYPEHIDGTNSSMGIYITSDVNTSGTISVGPVDVPFTVTANTIVRKFLGPNNNGDAPNSFVHLGGIINGIGAGKGIHVVSDKPVVVFSHIIRSARSGATLVLPTKVWGKEYIVPSFSNMGNTTSFGEIAIVAAARNTQVEITPGATTRDGRPVGVPFTVTITDPGDVYQLQFQQDADLSGTKIRSIASAGGGCSPIGVFSATTWSGFSCNNASGGDNLFQQLFPVGAWGKDFVTGPLKKVATNPNDNNIDFVRVFVKDPNTVVNKTENGVTTTLTGLVAPGNFYQYATSRPTLISADQPVQVAQYVTSQTCGSPQTQSDPEMIILSAVEQTINNITVFSAHQNFVPPNQSAVSAHFLNIIMKSNSIASFRINGAFPNSAFTTIPGTLYSYLKEDLTSRASINPVFNITADSGFSAIAYGFGQFESYGYNAGTNVRDLYQQIGTSTPYGGATSPKVCVGSSTKFKISLPYAPDSIYWDFLGSQSPNVKLSSPPLPITPDSIRQINGKNVYWYSLPNPYIFNTPGIFPYLITTYSQNADGCGATQEIEGEIEVFPNPTADFTFVTDGCVSNPVSFTESNVTARPISSRYWDFGDASTATTSNPSHLFATAGNYEVKFSYINDIGCKADTSRHTVTLNTPPEAEFIATGPYCAGVPISFTNLSDPIPGGTYQWTFGDAGNSALENPVHTYSTPGIYTVTLIVTTSSGCASVPFPFQITVNSKPVADFNLPGVCLPNGNAQFNDGSLPGTGNTLTSWAWDFGDLNTSTQQNPLHIYSSPAPFTVSLTVTNDKGCADTKTQILNTVFEEPQAAFSTPANVCLGASSTFTDNSTALNNTVTGWAWDFGDGNTSTAQHPVHTYLTAGPFTVTLNVTTAAGCPTVTRFATQQVNVLALPTATVSGNASVCVNGTSPQITFTGSGGTAPYTFTYTIDNGAGPVTQAPVSTVSGNSITVPVPTGTAGTYRYAITNVKEGSTAGCAQSQSGFIDVLVRPLPVATISTAISVCVNGAFPDITFTGANGTAPYTFGYKINNGPTLTISTIAGNSRSVAVPTNAVGTFTYEIISIAESSPNACTNNLTGVSTTVNVKPLPSATIIGAAEVCLNAPSHNIVLNGTGGTAPYKFRYRIVGDPTPSYEITSDASGTGQIIVPTSVAGTFVYELIDVTEGSTSACTQSQVGSVTVIVMPLPTSDFNVELPTCDRDAVTFTNTSIPNAGSIVRWKWRFADTEPQVVMTSGNPFTYVFPGPGTYNVSLEVETDKGCASNVRTTPVVVEFRPAADFSTPIACINDVAAQFLDNGNVSAGNVMGWEWDFGDANANAGNPNTSSQKNPTHHFTVPGPYTVRQIVISDKGCRDTLEKTFTVNGMPNSNFSVEHAGAVCSNQQITIKDAASSTFGDIIKTEIFWDYLNDPTAKTNDASPTSGKQYVHSYPEFGTPATKTFRIRYVAYTGDNCISSFERDVTLMATPTLLFDEVPGVCADVPAFQVMQAQLTNALPGPPGVFTGMGISPTGLFDPSVATPGSHLIRYTFVGSNGCSNFVERTIDVYPVPVLNAGPDKVLLQGGQVMLTPAQNVGLPITYSWTPTTGLSNPAIAFPIASPADDILYTLTVTTEFGCEASDVVFVKVLKKPLIPNIFSPNGDGIHDRWELPYLESYPGCTIDLYNRYGQLVFHTVGYATAWDGKVNGKDVPVGTYYYVIDPKNGRPRLSGYVDIIR